MIATIMTSDRTSAKVSDQRHAFLATTKEDTIQHSQSLQLHASLKQRE